MIAQRPSGAARVVRASAEKLPLDDKSFDAAMAVNAVQHWTDLRAGLRELRRVTRKRVVFFLRDARAGTPFFALASNDGVEEGLARLRADLGSGEWDRRHGQLRSLAELDLGHRLLVAELG